MKAPGQSPYVGDCPGASSLSPTLTQPLWQVLCSVDKSVVRLGIRLVCRPKSAQRGAAARPANDLRHFRLKRKTKAT